jgi:hypothetical protein
MRQKRLPPSRRDLRPAASSPAYSEARGNGARIIYDALNWSYVEVPRAARHEVRASGACRQGVYLLGYAEASSAKRRPGPDIVDWQMIQFGRPTIYWSRERLWLALLCRMDLGPACCENVEAPWGRLTAVHARGMQTGEGLHLPKSGHRRAGRPVTEPRHGRNFPAAEVARRCRG